MADSSPSSPPRTPTRSVPLNHRQSAQSFVTDQLRTKTAEREVLGGDWRRIRRWDGHCDHPLICPRSQDVVVAAGCCSYGLQSSVKSFLTLYRHSTSVRNGVTSIRSVSAPGNPLDVVGATFESQGDGAHGQAQRCLGTAGVLRPLFEHMHEDLQEGEGASDRLSMRASVGQALGCAQKWTKAVLELTLFGRLHLPLLDGRPYKASLDHRGARLQAGD